MQVPFPTSATLQTEKAGLYLTEIFTSVQGETRFTGLPTVFVRLSGCNLRCTWCDTTYSFKRGEPKSLQEIVSYVEESGVVHVCITGGEPLLQEEVYSLMRALCNRGYTVSLETGGGVSIADVDKRVVTILDIKCPASGMAHKNVWDNIEHLKMQDEVKFVIEDRKDFDWAKTVLQQHNLANRVTSVLFSPVFGKLKEKQLVEWILAERLPVRLNLQTHKWIWSPETKGV